MPLPESSGDLKWPPDEWRHVFSRYHEHAAWFSGNPNQLASVYYAMGSRPQGFWRTNFDRFWARTPAPQTRLMLHEPIAAALAAVSSDLLFAEAPDFVIEEENGTGPVQARLNRLVEAESVVRTFSELGETVAALGGGFLRVIWDKDYEPDHPMLTAVDADSAIPDFRWGRLTGVTFFTIVAGSDYEGGMGLVSDDKAVYRLLERHEPGAILHGLYEGTRDHLGQRRPLGTIPGLPPDEVVETKIDGLTAVYVPNVRPNRIFRGTALGRSDYDGVEAEMDALDEAATSLMRDLRLARARLIVPEEMLTLPAGRGQAAAFDLDQEVWEGAPAGVPSFGNDKLITPSQFNIRADEHLKIIKAKIESIVMAAGYSPTSFGLDEPRRVPATATEIVNRERQSFLTRSKKIAYWTPPIEAILEAFLEVDAAHFQAHKVYRPRVDFADSIRDDEQQTATIVHILRSAEAMSAEMRVRTVHPKWTDPEVMAETKRILEEGAAPQPLPVASPALNGMPVAPNGQPAGQPQDGQRVGSFSQQPPPAAGE